jgi:L-amino acid N-acyltransferase YncA
VLIRDATADDWPAIWPFLHLIVAAGETFSYDRELTEQEARAMWLLPSPGRTVVAVASDGELLGSANMDANRPGPGAHVASANYMVDPRHAGRGVGRALVGETLDWARDAGFRAMQFNAVVETNEPAIALYRSAGFEVLGTVPEGFRHPRAGYVGLHIMYRRL